MFLCSCRAVRLDDLLSFPSISVFVFNHSLEQAHKELYYSFNQLLSSHVMFMRIECPAIHLEVQNQNSVARNAFTTTPRQ